MSCNKGCGSAKPCQDGTCPHSKRPFNFHIMPFALWVTNYTPVIPKFYWDVESQEERIKHIVMELDRLRAYVNYITCEYEKYLQRLEEDLARTEDLAEQLEKLIKKEELKENYFSVQNSYDKNTGDIVRVDYDLARTTFTPINEMLEISVSEYIRRVSKTEENVTIFNVQAIRNANKVLYGQPIENSDTYRFLYYGYFGFDESGNPMYIKDYDHQLTAQNLADMGMYNGTAVYYPIALDGQMETFEAIYEADSRAETNFATKQPRTVVAWNETTLSYFAIEGRETFSKGANFEEVREYFQPLLEEFPNIIMLGGGGDLQNITNIGGYPVNMVDMSGELDRHEYPQETRRVRYLFMTKEKETEE